MILTASQTSPKKLAVEIYFVQVFSWEPSVYLTYLDGVNPPCAKVFAFGKNTYNYNAALAAGSEISHTIFHALGLTLGMRK